MARFIQCGVKSPIVQQVNLAVENISDSLCGLRILFLTDIHFGKWVPDEHMKTLIDEVMAQAPDLIFFGGDLSDTKDGQRRVICDHLTRLKPPLGMFAVPGNNDWEAFQGDYSTMRKWLDGIGVRLLINETVSLTQPDNARLFIGGLDEPEYGRPDGKSLECEKRTGDVHIVLSHSPYGLDWALTVPKRYPDLALCGHTHGGQFALGNFTVYALGYDHEHAVGKKFFRVRGLDKHDDVTVLTSNGIGFSLMPMRIGAPSEMHIITLTRAI